MSDNIFTVRNIAGAKIVEINGRELSFVRDYSFTRVARDLYTVELSFDACQVNEVDHGEDVASRSTGNLRADNYLRVIANAYTLIRNARWWQLPRVIKEVRAMLEGVLK